MASVNVSVNTPVPSLSAADERAGARPSDTVTCGDTVDSSGSPVKSSTSPGFRTYCRLRSGSVSGRLPDRPSTREVPDGAGYWDTVIPVASAPTRFQVSDGLVAVPRTASLKVTVMAFSEVASADEIKGAKFCVTVTVWEGSALSDLSSASPAPAL